MAKYISNRLKNLTIGLDSYSENLTSLNIIGDVKVGAGVTISSSAGIVTAVEFQKVGGTNSQFMMADGSVNSSTFLTTESDTLDSILTRGNTTTKNLTVGDITADNISIGGTITYEDVTNVDSIGIITARKDIHVGAGLSVVGVSTFSEDIFIGVGATVGIATYAFFTDHSKAVFGESEDLQVYHDSDNGHSYIKESGTGNLVLQTDTKVEMITFNPPLGGGSEKMLEAFKNGAVSLYHGMDGASAEKKIETTTTGVFVTGILTATTFSGSGASLTSIPAGNLTGPLPAISGQNLTNVVTTDGGGQTTNIIVTGISSLGIGTADDATQGQTDLYHEGILRLKTTSLGVQVVGVMSATALDFTGATGAFANDVLFQGSSHSMNWDKSESYLQFNDGAKAVFGTDITAGDLEIFHSGQQSYISENGTGDLLLITGAVGLGSTAIKISDGASTIYYQGAERLRTTSTGIILTGTVTGSIDGNAATATKATDLNIDATQQLVIQTGNDATDVLASGTAGYVLQSNGSGNAPTWAASAPANAITGITVREDGGLVGSANSVSTINFTGAGVGVTFTNPVAGIATVTISAGGGEDSSAVMLSMIFG